MKNIIPLKKCRTQSEYNLHYLQCTPTIKYLHNNEKNLIMEKLIALLALKIAKRAKKVINQLKSFKKLVEPHTEAKYVEKPTLELNLASFLWEK